MKIQIFDPYSNIWQHSLPMKRVELALKGIKASVTTVRCSGTFASHCVAMSASRVSYLDSTIKKAMVCHACKERARLLNRDDRDLSINFSDFMEPSDRSLAIDVVSSCSPNSWSEFEYMGIKVGAISAYEFLLANKIDSLRIPQHLWQEFKSNLVNVVTTVIVAKRILSTTRPNYVLVYNSLYSLHNAYCAVAESMGIRTLTLQGGPHIPRKATTLTAFRKPVEIFRATYSREVQSWLSKPLDLESIELTSEHLIDLLSGQSAFTYSTPSSQNNLQRIQDFFQIDGSQQVLTVLISSEDEFFAANLEGAIPYLDSWNKVFDSQLEWLDWLIGFAVRHPELLLIIRIHPRMLPNKRENVQAPYVAQLQRLLQNLPENVKVNTPDQEISIYDLMQFTDVVLNKRSSAGVEMMSYGLPVVLPGDEFLFSCPPNICYLATNQEMYEEMIFKALEDGWSIDNVRNAYRWYGFIFRGTAVDVLPYSPSRINRVRPKRVNWKLKLWNILVFYFVQLGPKSIEKASLQHVDKDLHELGPILSVIGNNLEGIHEARTRESLPVGCVDTETSELVINLIKRLEHLSSDGKTITPLIQKISANIVRSS